MGALQRREQRPLHKPTAGTAPACARARAGVEVAGKDVSEMSWDRAALTLADAGLEAWARGGVAPLASGVEDETGARRRADGSYYRLRIGWVATVSEVVVHRLEQALERGLDGKLHTRGGYVLADVARYSSQGVPVRRAGQVPADAPSSPGGAAAGVTGGGVEPDVALRKRFERGFTALGLLPAPVRRSVAQRLRDPLVFTGQAVRHDHGERHSVDLVAISATGAIAVHAAAHRGTGVWQVEQYVYAWSAPAGPAVGGGSQPGAVEQGPRR